MTDITFHSVKKIKLAKIKEFSDFHTRRIIITTEDKYGNKEEHEIILISKFVEDLSVEKSDEF